MCHNVKSRECGVSTGLLPTATGCCLNSSWPVRRSTLGDGVVAQGNFRFQFQRCRRQHHHHHHPPSTPPPASQNQQQQAQSCPPLPQNPYARNWNNPLERDAAHKIKTRIKACSESTRRVRSLHSDSGMRGHQHRLPPSPLLLLSPFNTTTRATHPKRTAMYVPEQPHTRLAHPHGQYLIIEQPLLLGAVRPGVTLGRERILRGRNNQKQRGKQTTTTTSSNSSRTINKQITSRI